MPAYGTYEMVGIKEDISDVISNITPTDTPFISSISDEKIKNRVHQWQEDSLAAVNTTNYRVEAADATLVDRTPTVLRNNTTQILSDAFYISGTAEAVDTYGRESETALQKAKVGKQLKRDLEYMCVGKVQAAVTGDNATARRFASAFSQIAAGTTVDAGTAALDEDDILTLNQELYEEGGEATTMMIKPADALIVAGFAAISNQRIRDQGDSRKVVNAVDVYVSPFGEQRVKLNRHLLTSRALFYSPENWKRLVLRNWTSIVLAKAGDADKYQVLGEFSLKHKNQLASGMITNLT
jgi:hypothetical protein